MYEASHDDDPVARIAALFAAHGHAPYEGARREAVTALQHAVQCAQFAEWAHAPDTLVAAAFLHDIGHLLVAEAILHDDRLDDRHEDVAARVLAADFGIAVAEPVRLHVQAKRFLVRVDDGYAAALSPASQHSLALQGGPMSNEEITRFKRQPFADDAVLLRRWDDLAKDPARAAPPLSYYLPLLQQVRDSFKAGDSVTRRAMYTS